MLWFSCVMLIPCSCSVARCLHPLSLAMAVVATLENHSSVGGMGGRGPAVSELYFLYGNPILSPSSLNSLCLGLREPGPWNRETQEPFPPNGEKNREDGFSIQKAEVTKSLLSLTLDGSCTCPRRSTSATCRSDKADQ